MYVGDSAAAPAGAGESTDGALAHRLEQAEQRLRLYETILSNTPDLVYEFGLDHRFTYANRALLAMWGKTWEEAAGKNCLELGYEPWHAAMHDDEIERVVATKQAVRGEVPFTGTNGTRIYDYIFAPVIGPSGEVEAIAGTTRDVTDRKRHEERQKLLLDELNHRVKNTLSIVQSLATQTLRNAPTLERARELLDSRLVALAKAHDILTLENWSGATLEDIVEQAVAPCAGRAAGRLSIKGPDLRIPPKDALALSMGLHELCTNAVKYGALSNDSGKVEISWNVEGAKNKVLKMRWEEKNGPPVAPPSRCGFGTRLIQQGLRQDLEGDVALEFAPSGVVCTIAAPLAANA